MNREIQTLVEYQGKWHEIHHMPEYPMLDSDCIQTKCDIEIYSEGDGHITLYEYPEGDDHPNPACYCLHSDIIKEL